MSSEGVCIRTDLGLMSDEKYKELLACTKKLKFPKGVISFFVYQADKSTRLFELYANSASGANISSIISKNGNPLSSYIISDKEKTVSVRSLCLDGGKEKPEIVRSVGKNRHPLLYAVPDAGWVYNNSNINVQKGEGDAILIEVTSIAKNEEEADKEVEAFKDLLLKLKDKNVVSAQLLDGGLRAASGNSDKDDSKMKIELALLCASHESASSVLAMMDEWKEIGSLVESCNIKVFGISNTKSNGKTSLYRSIDKLKKWKMLTVEAIKRGVCAGHLVADFSVFSSPVPSSSDQKQKSVSKDNQQQRQSLGQAMVQGVQTKEKQKAATTKKSAGGAAFDGNEENVRLFSVQKNPNTGTHEAIHFRTLSTAARQKRDEEIRRKCSAAERPAVVVPLLPLIRKLTGMSHTTASIDCEVLYFQLGRLRSLADDVKTLSAEGAVDPAKSTDEERHRVQCVRDNLAAFGYPVPSGLVYAEIEDIDELIATLEEGNAEVVQSARQALASDGSVHYAGLQEHFKIGDLVVAPASPLGGAPVVYRVCDVYYETLRSIFGGQKVSFHMAVECIASLGDTFAFVSFDDIIPEYEGSRSVRQLPYVHLDKDEKEELRRRGAAVVALGTDPAYRQYRSSCFFAHGGGKKSGGVAAQISGSGRLVVDTRRGLELGHHVAPGFEPASLAIQATVKAYRTVKRAMADGEPSAKRRERVEAAGLRLLETVPDGMAHMVWPAVVGFGLGVKRWGHVLVDGLSEVPPGTDAWSRLVLDKSKKELLLSLVERQFDPSAPDLQDLVSGKGSGSLFLLHGQPGTGKTLTVEALAERFGVPLYSLTFGELGTTVSELESRMGEVLSLCSGWGALVLLDEGDALVERREKGALVMNSMVGVLLKALDAFEGLLFITTNRVASFDPAALSRVTLAIRYGSLKTSGRQQVWKNVLHRAGVNPNNFNTLTLAKRGGSGRDINAAARLALALAHHRKGQVTQQLLFEVLDIADDFKKDFAGGLEAHTDGGRISDDEDDDVNETQDEDELKNKKKSKKKSKGK